MEERGCGNQGLKKKEKCAVSLISTLLHVFFFFSVLVACIYPLIMSVMEKK